MFSLDQARKIDPDLASLSDGELRALLETMYGFANLACDEWFESDKVPKIPLGYSPEKERHGSMEIYAES
jgi:hypothetical protein